MTRGGLIRRAKTMLRALCAKKGHQWDGDGTCEVCSADRKKL